ncbi:hypothetical protein T440DRAFT_478149 [Plenodomus tracheiphilus IPT5]|uniref:Small ribosomal subunit protein mS38 n=1 Tax=Plenodomus tracheiphilus IPT5 TaxID=1408161 RepID=A0A6A7BBV1_9PLEO|nr:hypothetical protein T440DRAFT_478149 [Plenodomus tracheiphilus IPT5]
MFSPVIGRAARSTNTFGTAPASCLLRTTLSPASQQPFRPGHQRRLSSSKPSPPPSSKKKAALLEENATAKQEGSERPAAGTRKKKQKAASTATPVHNIPYVEPTRHVDSAGTLEVKMSSFFGLHRPMSFSQEIPHATSTAEFNALFDPAKSQDARQRQAVHNVLQNSLDTLEDAIENLEIGRKTHFERPGPAPAAQEEPLFHLDRLYEHTAHSVKAVATWMVPFAPPPVPTPHDKLAVQFKAVARILSGGIDNAITQVPLPAPRVDRSTPFRKHVARRRFVDSMLLISVKRQRKLKMKKHKYKKLMKRTRLERRKLGRL